jgi:hypothetical protein
MNGHPSGRHGPPQRAATTATTWSDDSSSRATETLTLRISPADRALLDHLVERRAQELANDGVDVSAASYIRGLLRREAQAVSTHHRVATSDPRDPKDRGLVVRFEHLAQIREFFHLNHKPEFHHSAMYMICRGLAEAMGCPASKWGLKQAANSPKVRSSGQIRDDAGGCRCVFGVLVPDSPDAMPTPPVVTPVRGAPAAPATAAPATAASTPQAPLAATPASAGTAAPPQVPEVQVLVDVLLNPRDAHRVGAQGGREWIVKFGDLPPIDVNLDDGDSLEWFYARAAEAIAWRTPTAR